MQPTSNWSLAQLLAFRFCLIYFGGFCIGTQILSGLVPLLSFNDLFDWQPIRGLIFATAASVFHAKLPLVYTGSGSGDKTFDWTVIFLLFFFAVCSTIVWSVLDRKRTNYARGYLWFRLFIRFALAAQLLGYGIAKVLPEQMPYPSLIRMIEPYGQFSPMGVLWASIGASPAYEIFAGSAEVLAGVLLVVPRTALLGALVAMADMTQVFTLNMTYDVPVKILSSHLLLFALFIAAPDARRLVDFFFFSRDPGVSPIAPLFDTSRANRLSVALQIAFGLFLLVTNVVQAVQGWTDAAGAPKAALYGIWNVRDERIDGRESFSLANARALRRVVFDSTYRTGFQRVDDTIEQYSTAYEKSTIVLRTPSRTPVPAKATLTYRRTSPDRLILAGRFDGQNLVMNLERDTRKAPLGSRGFHWIQEYPYNR